MSYESSHDCSNTIVFPGWLVIVFSNSMEMKPMKVIFLLSYCLLAYIRDEFFLHFSPAISWSYQVYDILSVSWFSQVLAWKPGTGTEAYPVVWDE